MIELSVRGLREARVATVKLERSLQSYVEWFRGFLSGAMTKYFRQRFESEGALHGTRWASLHPRTWLTSAKVRRGGILWRYGTLARSFISPGAVSSLERIAPHEYLRGSRRRYAIFHQEGTRTMPARPIIVIPPALADFWLKALAQYVKTKADEAFGGPTVAPA